MDINAALTDFRALMAAADAAEMEIDAEDARMNAAEVARGIDEWLSSGGFLPDAWQRKGE